MSLDKFFGSTAPAPPPPTEDANAQTAAPGEGEAPSGGVSVVTVPSGMEIYFQETPKRLYRIDGEEVPSMSGISDILDAPGLVSWGEKVGINLVQELLRGNYVAEGDIRKIVKPEVPNPRQPWWGGAHLQEMGGHKKLRTHQMRDHAATRGNNVHLAMESWAMSGEPPDPDLYPAEERQYVVGLVKFLNDAKPKALKSEVVVGSKEHRVAGRYDLLATHDEFEGVYHLTPKNEKRKQFKAGSRLWDLKTSAGVFLSQHFQVAGYHSCMFESGYEVPEHKSVLRVTADGRYEIVDVVVDSFEFGILRLLYDLIEGEAGIKHRLHQNQRKEM